MLYVHLQHFISLLCHTKRSKQTAGLLAGNWTEQLNVTEGGGCGEGGGQHRFLVGALPSYSSLTGMTPGLHLWHVACSVCRAIEAYFLVMTNNTNKSINNKKQHASLHSSPRSTHAELPN